MSASPPAPDRRFRHLSEKEIAEIVVEGEGDYVLAVKDNQPTLHAEMQAAFATAGPIPRRRDVTTFTSDHGREESRTVRVLPAAKHLSAPTLAAWMDTGMFARWMAAA